jgi:hypothetical protein
MKDAAAAYGQRAEMAIPARSAFDTDIAAVRLAQAKPVDYPLPCLERRRTIRKGQLPR